MPDVAVNVQTSDALVLPNGVYGDMWIDKKGELFVANEDGVPIAATIATLTHTRTATTHTLVGTMPTTGLVSATFKATSDYTEGNTFSINGTAYTAKPNGEELTLPDKAFVTGDVVTVAVDVVGKKINFRVGGGGTKVPSIFGDGSDGDLIIKAGQTVTLPVEHPHKDIIIKQYKSILIETNGKLTTAAPNCGFVIKCKGDCTIDGVIDQSGKGGFTNYDITYEYPAISCGAGGVSGVAGQGGMNGGAPGVAANVQTPARNYGGGIGVNGAGAGSGAATQYSGPGSNRYSGNKGQNGTSSNTAIVKSFGGAEAGNANGYGGRGGKGGDGGTGNYGGGLILLYVGGKATIRGSILCNGLAGSNGERGAYGGSNYNPRVVLKQSVVELVAAEAVEPAQVVEQYIFVMIANIY